MEDGGFDVKSRKCLGFTNGANVFRSDHSADAELDSIRKLKSLDNIQFRSFEAIRYIYRLRFYRETGRLPEGYCN